MSAPFQLELLADNASPLFGLRVQLPDDCPDCGINIAVIGRGAAPHYGELKCENCGKHGGWLSKATASWITAVINKFGAPTTPIILRRR